MKCIQDATYEEEIHKIQPITVLFVKDLTLTTVRVTKKKSPSV